MENLLKKIDEQLVNSCRESKSKGGLFIPFDGNELNLGYFLIWGERNNKKKFIPSEQDMELWISSWYKFMANLIAREFKINKKTFLPEYFTAGWKQVAVLFADIRNFTTMTENLRVKRPYNGSESNGLNEIVNGFCSEMCQVISNTNGRIDKFMGDAVMVIFCEDGGHPSKVACEAINAAGEMVKSFQKRKKEWERKAFGKNFEIEFNESIEIDIGIGIDFGYVFFDYFGEYIHREYSAIGDHVNFASRLQGMAAKMHEETKKLRPHIIMSRTVYRFCKPWLREPKELTLDFKRESHHYKCYGIEPDQFDLALYNTSHSCGNWKSAWEKGDMEPPYNSEKPWYKNL